MKNLVRIKLMFLLASVLVCPRSLIVHDGWVEGSPMVAARETNSYEGTYVFQVFNRP